MKKIILLSVICLICLPAYTQQVLPSFFRDTANINLLPSISDFSNNDSISMASIYRSYEWLPYAPQKAGKITHVYLHRRGGACTANHVDIYLGYQTAPNFNGITTFSEGSFTKVVSDRSIVFPFHSTKDTLIYTKIALDDTNFYYNPHKNLVMLFAYNAPANCASNYDLHSNTNTDTTFAQVRTSTFEITVNPATGKLGKLTTQFFFGFDIDSTQVLSTRDIDRHGHLKLYPNPAKDKLYITNAKYGQNYMVSDITGKILLQGKMKQEGYIEIQDLVPGLYIIKLGHQAMKFLKE